MIQRFIFISLILLACLPVQMAWSEAKVVKRSDATGDQIFRTRAFKKVAVKDDTTFKEKDIIVTKNGSLVIELPDGTEVGIGKNTRVKVSQLIAPNSDEEQNFEIMKGTAVFKVKKLKKGKFRIKTPVAVVAVRGTFFIVQHKRKTRRFGGNSSISVLSGRVEVGSLKFSKSALAKPVNLKKLQASDVSSSATPSPPRTISVQEANQLESEAGLDATTAEELEEEAKNEGADQSTGQDGDLAKEPSKVEQLIDQTRKDLRRKALEGTGVSTSEKLPFTQQKLNDTILKRKITTPIAPPSTP